MSRDPLAFRTDIAGPIGDAANAVLAAVGYNFRRILAWIRVCLAIIWAALTLTNCQPQYSKHQTQRPQSANRRSSQATNSAAINLYEGLQFKPLSVIHGI